MDIKVFSPDYVLESQQNTLNTASEFNNTIIEMMALEANFFLDLVEGVMEATTKEVVVGGAKKAFATTKLVSNVIAFIKNIFNRFKDFMQTTFQNNEKWLAERKADFSKMNYEGLSISMVPYWNGEGKGQFAKINQAIEKIDAVDGDGKQLEGLTSRDTFNEKVLGEFSLDGDVATGIKNFYRVGKASGEDAQELAGDTLKGIIVNRMIPYVLGYSKNISEIQGMVNRTQNQLKVIERELKSRGVKESAIFRTAFEQTDFAMIHEFDTLFENTNDNKDKQHSSSGSTKVEMKTAEKNEANQQKEFVKGLETTKLQVLRNVTASHQLNLAAAMTVSQERQTAYVNALKAVYKSANTRHGRKGNTKEETK